VFVVFKWVGVYHFSYAMTKKREYCFFHSLLSMQKKKITQKNLTFFRENEMD